MIDFELIIPEGWVQIPATPETARLRRKVIDTVIRTCIPESLPRDKAGPWRRMLRRELTDAAEEAARQGARSVVLPLKEFNGHALPGSLVMTVIEEDADDAEDAEKLLASILSDAGPGGTYLEIGGAPTVRVESVVDSARVGRRAPSCKVAYFVSNPDAPGVWGLLTFTVLSDGDVDAAPVQAVVLLFDALVSTLRWGDRVDVPTEDEVLALLGGPAPAEAGSASRT